MPGAAMASPEEGKIMAAARDSPAGHSHRAPHRSGHAGFPHPAPRDDSPLDDTGSRMNHVRFGEWVPS
jgi:hypothetical protein